MGNQNLWWKILSALSRPSYPLQKKIAALVVFSQILITFTGSIVRVTSSGLGCTTWPQCNQGSFIFKKDNHTALYHQIIEFSNRQISVWFVSVCSILIVWVAYRSHYPRKMKLLAVTIPLGTIIQALIGGVTVLHGLLWWIVAMHLLVSLLMVWCAMLLFSNISAADTLSSRTEDTPAVIMQDTRYAFRLHQASIYAAIAAGITVITGTLVTGAGPLAGDMSPDHTIKRLQVNIVYLIIIHVFAVFVLFCSVCYIELLLSRDFNYETQQGTYFGFTIFLLPLLLLVQVCVGIMQTYLKLPPALVMMHVLFAALIIALLAKLYAQIQLARNTIPEEYSWSKTVAKHYPPIITPS